MQGPQQDVFLLAQGIDLNLTDAPRMLTIAFNVADSFYFEDYENDGRFIPCGHGLGNPGDACFDGSGWAAIFPEPEIVVGAAP